MVLFCISYRVVCKILEISETALFYYQYTFSENFKLKEILGDFDVIFISVMHSLILTIALN